MLKVSCDCTLRARVQKCRRFILVTHCEALCVAFRLQHVSEVTLVGFHYSDSVCPADCSANALHPNLPSVWCAHVVKLCDKLTVSEEVRVGLQVTVIFIIRLIVLSMKC